MTPERRVTLLTWGTGILALAATWISFGLASDNLPEPIAVQWANSMTPNSSQPHLVFAGAMSLLIGVQFLILLVNHFTGGNNRKGAMDTRLLCALCGFLSTSALSGYGLIVWINWGLDHWTEARFSITGVLLMLVVSLGAGALGWLAGTKTQRLPTSPEPALEIPTGARVSWSGSITKPILFWTVALISVVSIGSIYLSVGLTLEAHLITAALVPVLLLASALMGPIAVSIGRTGVIVRFGILGWPRWTIPLRDLDEAAVETRTTMEVGGWGLRFYPGGKAVMLRSGECLVIQRHGDLSEVTISIDDAKTAAATINALRQKQTQPLRW